MRHLRLQQVGSNQTVLHIGLTQVLFSYETPVAAYYPSQGYIYTMYSSVTTARHIKKFLDGHEAKPVAQTQLDNLLNVEVI